MAAEPGSDDYLPTGVTLRGTVRRWNQQKGFGFIAPDNGGPDVFVHARELTDGDALVLGAPVTFEAVEETSKGPGMYRTKTCSGAVPKDELEFAAPPTDNLFVTGLPKLSEDGIRNIFSQYGKVASVKILPNQAGKNDTAVLLRMTTVEDAKWLVENVHSTTPSRLKAPVQISYAQQKMADGRAPGSLATPPALDVLTETTGGYGTAITQALSLGSLGQDEGQSQYGAQFEAHMRVLDPAQIMALAQAGATLSSSSTLPGSNAMGTSVGSALFPGNASHGARTSSWAMHRAAPY
eukprot:CAMPEP_0117547550 /NCGR_PEP_ID=MMETSP0784-20121206/47182_1 /TAXON_ID=39447 /ORGANISM="" /LENGTH=293 /DNA_ID=CAMNT_0005344459 /DNA_START=67 /DNA_END=948 /DNA_ORIENTATION=+